MRCYNINCFQLAGIHAGIQSGHAQKELSVKYLINKDSGQSAKATETLTQYLLTEKTVVILNGGMYGDLLKVEAFLGKPENTDYAWAAFRESEYALNNTLTNVAVVLPWHIYQFKREITALMEEEYPTGIRVVDLGGGRHLSRRGDSLKLTVCFEHEFGKPGEFEFSDFEIGLIKMITPMQLMN